VESTEERGAHNTGWQRESERNWKSEGLRNAAGGGQWAGQFGRELEQRVPPCAQRSAAFISPQAPERAAAGCDSQWERGDQERGGPFCCGQGRCCDRDCCPQKGTERECAGTGQSRHGFALQSPATVRLDWPEGTEIGS